MLKEKTTAVTMAL